MDCLAYCTADSYEIKLLFENMHSKYRATLLRDVVQVTVDADDARRYLFCFSYGVVVFWGFTQAQASHFLEQFHAFETGPTEHESDEFQFTYGHKASIVGDLITLPDSEPLTKLAFSHSIAQSVKLSVFESKIQKTFNSNAYLPEELARHGRIPLSRHDIRRKMGELFIERSRINLRFDTLDTPEFFWEYPEYDSIYRITSIYLDTPGRVGVLNQRLRIIHELFEMLGNELNHQHSSLLEWTIILLIVIEVILVIAKDILKWI